MRKLIFIFSLTYYFVDFSFSQNMIYQYNDLPRKNNFSNWDKNRNMNYESGLIAWNGREIIEGNCASNGLIGDVMKDNYKPVNNPGSKETLCGTVSKIYFADDPNDTEHSEIELISAGLYEAVFKQDYDLDIYMVPNDSYRFSHSRRSCFNRDPGYYGVEVQLDHTTVKEVELVKDIKAAKDKEGQTFLGFLVDTAMVLVGELKSTKIVNCTKANRKYYPFINDLEINDSLCVYGSLTYDLLNSRNCAQSWTRAMRDESPVDNNYTKTEIHPIEQIWYKVADGVIVFATLFDRSHRFDEKHKNTLAKPWIKASLPRKYARPFELEMKLNNDVGFTDYIVLDCVIYKDAQAEEVNGRSREKAMENFENDREFKLFEVRKDGVRKAIIRVFAGSDIDDLDIYLEDLHVDNLNPNKLRGLIIISTPFRNNVYNYFEQKNHVSFQSGLTAVAIDKMKRASKLKMIRFVNSHLKRDATLSMSKLSNDKKELPEVSIIRIRGAEVFDNYIYTGLSLEGPYCNSWEPIEEPKSFKLHSLVKQEKQREIYQISVMNKFTSVKIKNKISNKIVSVKLANLK